MTTRPQTLRAALVLVLLGAGGAHAEEVCRLPETIPAARPDTVDWRNDDRTPDGFVLALSWSPAYCAAEGGPADAIQCGDNRFGWVVHGLWAQTAGADDMQDHPRHCRAAAPLPEATLRRYLCLIPSVDLIQHEWAAHGTCAFDTAEAYLAQTAALWDALVRPDMAGLAAHDDATAGDVRDAWTEANPGLPRDAVGLSVRDGLLREVRLCYDTAYAFEACAWRGAPDGERVEVVAP